MNIKLNNKDENSIIKAAYNYCMYLLSNREYSSQNLKHKLTQKYKSIDNNDISNIILKLQNKNFLCDKRYSEIRSRSLIRKLYGPYYIKNYLKLENIEQNTINTSLEKSIQDLNIDWDKQVNKYLNKYNYDFSNNSIKYKNKWRNKLYNRGFETYYINKIL